MGATTHTALVTGGMGGLGEAIARHLHDAGHTVLVTHARSDEAARRALGGWLDALAHAVQIVAQTLDPRWVLVSGGISEVGAPLLTALRETLRRRARNSAFLRELALDERCLLVPPGLDIASVGACLTALGTTED